MLRPSHCRAADGSLVGITITTSSMNAVESVRCATGKPVRARPMRCPAHALNPRPFGPSDLVSLALRCRAVPGPAIESIASTRSDFMVPCGRIVAVRYTTDRAGTMFAGSSAEGPEAEPPPPPQAASATLTTAPAILALTKRPLVIGGTISGFGTQVRLVRNCQRYVETTLRDAQPGAEAAFMKPDPPSGGRGRLAAMVLGAVIARLICGLRVRRARVETIIGTTRRQFEEITSHTNAAIYICDRESRYMMANPAYGAV